MLGNNYIILKIQELSICFVVHDKQNMNEMKAVLIRFILLIEI
jgi:hypothetical protein